MSASAGLRQRAVGGVDVEILDQRAPSDAGSSDSEVDYLTEQERNTPGFTPPNFTMKEVSTLSLKSPRRALGTGSALGRLRRLDG